MWLYEELPSWLRSPTNPPPPSPRPPRGSLGLCVLVRSQMRNVHLCVHTCVPETLPLGHMCPHGASLPLHHRTHWPVSQSGCDWVWVIKFTCPVTCPVTLILLLPPSVPPPSPIRPFTSVHHLLSLCRLMSHTKRKWDKSSQTAIRATSKSLVGQKTGRRRQSQKRTNTSSQFYSSSRTRTRLLDVPRSK